MATNLAGIPIAVALALSLQSNAGAVQQAEAPSFERLAALMANGSLAPVQAPGAERAKFAQWFNFNQWNNCISGNWRNC